MLPHSDCSAAPLKRQRRQCRSGPVLAEGHGALGQAILCRDFAWERAEQQLLRSIELNPNYADARVWYAFQLAMEGRFAESLREAAIARQLDPQAILSGLCLGFCTYQSRRYAEALAFCDQTLKGEPQKECCFLFEFRLEPLRHQRSPSPDEQGCQMVAKLRYARPAGSRIRHAGDAARAEGFFRTGGSFAASLNLAYTWIGHSAWEEKAAPSRPLEKAFETRTLDLWLAVERSSIRFATIAVRRDVAQTEYRLATRRQNPHLGHGEFTQSRRALIPTRTIGSYFSNESGAGPLPRQRRSAPALCGRGYRNAPHCEG